MVLLTAPVVWGGGEDFEKTRETWREFRSLSKVEQRRIHKIYRDFQKRDEQSQTDLRHWGQEFSLLPEIEREQIKLRLRRWKLMTSDQRLQLRQRWRTMGDKDRSAYE